MSHSSIISPQTIKGSTKGQFCRVVLILAIILSFLFSPAVKVTAQTSTQDTLTYSYKIYLPIVRGGEKAYFVSPTGNDANPGTFRLPWRTIVKAAQMVRPGDLIYIREGIYPAYVHFRTSGTEANPIRIMAYPGEYPIIDGGFNGEWGLLLYIEGDYNYISGIEVRNSAGQGIYVTGSYDVIDNVYVHHCMAAGIWIGYGQHSTIQNSRVWRTALRNEYGVMKTGWPTGVSAARDGVSYVTIRNNTVWEIWGEGISSFEADHTIIENNIVHDSWSANIYISDSTNVLCQRNFVYTDPTSYVFPFGVHSGIMMGDEVYNPPSANITVINNISIGNQGNFWWWPGVQGGGMNNVLIANNTFINGIGALEKGRGGVIISEGDHQNVRFENNIVQQDGELPVIAFDRQIGIIYSHNLWSKTPYYMASGPGDIIGNPIFTQIGNPYMPIWYTLTSVSPAIDRALTLSEVVTDYFGISREAPPDVGANEFFPTP